MQKLGKIGNNKFRDKLEGGISAYELFLKSHHHFLIF
jgi:hypothetical protein